MVIAEEFKNSEMVYERLDSIFFINSNTSVAINNINRFHEDDLEIEIETYFPADGLQRGWVGNMHYMTTHGLDVKTGKDVNSRYEKCVKDVLLARVNSYKDGPECVIFTYTFLKY